MKKVKITFDRENCIGAANCSAVDPTRWKMTKDGKADLQKAVKDPKSGKWVLELEVDEDELKNIKEGALSCPVQVIEVKEIS